jgi:hypothetical protein
VAIIVVLLAKNGVAIFIINGEKMRMFKLHFSKNEFSHPVVYNFVKNALQN